MRDVVSTMSSAPPGATAAHSVATIDLGSLAPYSSDAAETTSAEAAASAYGRCRSPASRVRLLQALGEVREVRALMDDAEKWWSEVPCDV